ncbi:alpha/beta hydrolase [Trinickia sp. YCB016]
MSAVALPAVAQEQAGSSTLHPVAVIADARLPIDTQQGHAEFPLYVSGDWSTPQPRVERAVIVIHGRLRNADVYYRTAEKARDAAGVDAATTLLIAPQFLATIDATTHTLPEGLLRWKGEAWEGGEAAVGSVPISSYAVLDAILARLADRRLFPNLKYVTIAGHSGGAQVVQRYAIAEHGTQALTDEGIDVRYVVANPSSYAYFDRQRPDAQGVAGTFDAAQCPSFDAWKYGMEDRPAYVNDRTPAQLEAAFVKRRVDYLLGGDDIDPQHPALDKSCMAEAQGPHRMARGRAYFAYLQSRHPGDLNQSLHIVPGVGHNGDLMLSSPCALHAMFGTGECAD